MGVGQFCSLMCLRISTRLKIEMLPRAHTALSARNGDLVLGLQFHFEQHVRMDFRQKIVAWDDLPKWRAAMRVNGKKLAVTNGCFDLLHLGHVTYLETARNHGEA